MIRRSLLLIALLLLSAIAAHAAREVDVTSLPGYVDLEWIEIPGDAEEIQDVDLGLVLLGIAAAAEEEADTELAQALSMIKSIRVRAFSVDDGLSREVDDAVARIERELEEDDWSRVIYVRDGDESVTVNVKRHDGELVGLMVVAVEDDESVAFVNVVGDLDLGTLFGLARQFEEDDIESLIEQLRAIEDDI